jgi:hypothetical protein
MDLMTIDVSGKSGGLDNSANTAVTKVTADEWIYELVCFLHLTLWLS